MSPSSRARAHACVDSLSLSLLVVGGYIHAHEAWTPQASERARLDTARLPNERATRGIVRAVCTATRRAWVDTAFETDLCLPWAALCPDDREAR